MNNSIVVAGCENGKLAIWDLNTNSLNHMDISNVRVSSLFAVEGMVITGDAQGNLKVVNGAGAVVLQSPQIQQGHRQPAEILTINIIPGPKPIVMAGDTAGQMHFLTEEDSGQTLMCSQGGHNDKTEAVLKVITCPIENQNAPVTIDQSGNFRLWM